MLSAFVVVVVAQSGCSVRDSRWEPSALVLLRFADGRPWGVVHPIECVGQSLAIDTTATFLPDGGATLELERFGLNLSAHVGDLPVFSRDGGDFGLGFTASPHTPLTIRRELDGGVVEVVPHSREDVTPLQPWSARREQCADLHLERRHDGSIVGDQLERETRLLDARGRPVFLLEEGTRLEARGRAARALLDDGATISGWLESPRRPSETVTATLRGAAICCSGAQPPPRDCASRLRLFATNGGPPREFGTLDAATFFDVSASDGDWVTIQPRASFFGMASGWRLVVRAEDLERCSLLD